MSNVIETRLLKRSKHSKKLYCSLWLLWSLFFGILAKSIVFHANHEFRCFPHRHFHIHKRAAVLFPPR
jgi:hypothetical protein